MIEQPDTGNEQHRREVDLYLVEQPGAKTLLRNARAHEAHVLFAGGRLRLLDGAVYTVGDEDETALARWHMFRDVVRQHEHWQPGQRPVSAPGVRDVVGSPTGHDRSTILDQLFEYLGTAAGELEGRHRHTPTRGLPVVANRGVAVEVPIEQPPTAVAQRPPATVVRTGDETIERHRKSCDHPGHDLCLLAAEHAAIPS